jgi:hypothetical protein
MDPGSAQKDIGPDAFVRIRADGTGPRGGYPASKGDH